MEATRKEDCEKLRDLYDYLLLKYPPAKRDALDSSGGLAREGEDNDEFSNRDPKRSRAKSRVRGSASLN